MSRDPRRSIASAGSESIGSPRARSTSAHGERSSSNPPSFPMDMNHYDTALPPINFHQTPIVHRRTGSTLKTVMRKIFNRKRQSQADGLEESPHEAYYNSSPSRQSPPTLGNSFLSVPTPTDSKRSSPLSEENLLLAETHLSPTRLTSPGFPGMPPRRRRATLPSVIFSEDESRFGVASSAISAISDPQEERLIPESQRKRSMIQARRRSRSIGAIGELADEPSMSRKWPTRTASIPNSVPDSRSPPLEGSSASDRSGRPSTGTTVTSVTRASAAPSIRSDDHADHMSLPPNLGNLVRSMQQDDGLTVEQRVNTLEVKMIDLEFAIARMQSNSAEPHSISRRKQTPSADSLTPNVRNRPSGLSSTTERDESPSPLSSLPVRPTSTSTIRPETMHSRTLRPAPSTTSLSDYTAVSIEQYSALVTLLRREQTARRNLESQVSSLRDDIRHIQRAALQSMEMGQMYPMHTVDSQEFLRFRRALDDSDSSSPIRVDGKDGSDSDWDKPEKYDPFGPPKWEQGKRLVTAPMI
ncbi:hypothetical protein N7448_007076 [Penicillium atrosanguineum]|uniref:Uncharacterized protein n=1 Tax=Penicillium atrosanguineum TaxID=1132637 RepID=A0A9W9L238_9EURO|nr:acetyltransferase GNAT family [Penicillium atrosanguineum]KAJ5132918.1 hypothetical protein N7448_007076 [Penicillium atrosanguineum]KAJ5141192.1 hypothetical protein N7526_002187 [Penicillium atrosanguineum]KAJ5290585.1 acetyltransferase GNAT family [Penicillium atrosanguineum]KAJ5308407.1 hypothetical protein N7476_009063 [Penicillium atrosanguineum]